MKFYVELDVSLLADVFEDYRQSIIDTWGCDPAFFHGMPSLGYYAARQMMGENEMHWCSMPTDKDLFNMYWRNIRGGITNSIHRHQIKGDGQILYFDVNSLYGSVMANHMFPVGSTINRRMFEDGDEGLGALFEVLTSETFENELIGVHAFVSISFPVEIHDDQPLPLCERKEGNGLSNNFYDIEHQLHSGHRILQMIKHGLIVHSCSGFFTFDVAPKYAEYIKGNMTNRKIAIDNNDASRSNTFKLANNAVYGKTIENAEKYTEVVVSVDPHDVEFCTSTRTVDIDTNALFVGIRPQSGSVTCKNPWDGFEVLEQSKTIFYDGIKRFTSFPGTKLLYCDTDSCIIYNPSPNFYEELKEFEQTKDIIVENKEYGKWQLEFPPNKIVEYVSTTQKAYFLEFDDGGSMKKHKGITKNTELTKQDYLDAIYKDEPLAAEQVQLRMNRFEVRTTRTSKLALSAKNNKRIVLHDGRTTLPYGYHGRRFNIGGAGIYEISGDDVHLEGDTGNQEDN